MTAVTYIAKRRIISTHAIGETYGLDLNAQEVMPSIKKNESSQESLSGATETFLYYLKEAFDVTLEPLREWQLDLVLEFLHSVAGKETFTFDAYGSQVAANHSLSVILTSDPYSMSPFMRLGRGGANDWFVVSFSVREA